MIKLNVIIEKDLDGYYAFCPELKGCHSQGDNYLNALANIREAIELYLETFNEEEVESGSSLFLVEKFNAVQSN